VNLDTNIPSNFDSKPKAYNKYKITVQNSGVNITHIYDSEDNFFTINIKRNLFKPYHITI
jgi:hypothetical protein